MIDRHCAGVFPDKPHTVFRAPDGSIVYEEMFTRGGFAAVAASPSASPQS